jgi:hypothetical protein
MESRFETQYTGKVENVLQEEKNPGNSYKFREVHNVEKEMIYDTVMSIQKVVVDQEQINKERDDYLVKQIMRLSDET